MSYQITRTITDNVPVVVNAYTVDASLSSLPECSLHTIQCAGTACLVEIMIGNNGSYISLDILVDAVENITAYGITAIRLTVATGTCVVSISGNIQ